MKLYVGCFNYEGACNNLDEIFSSVNQFKDYRWFCDMLSWPCENKDFYDEYFKKPYPDKTLNYSELLKLIENNNSDSYTIFGSKSSLVPFAAYDYLYDRDWEFILNQDFDFLLWRLEPTIYIAGKDEAVIEEFLLKNPDFESL